MNSAFIDSNVIVRYFTGDVAAKELLDPVIHGIIKGFINAVVFSEVIYIAIRLITGKKAYELKEDPSAIRNSINTLRDHIEFIRTYFSELEIDDEVKRIAIEVMEQYGLLPNDALIAATCKRYGIKRVITFDDDFKRIPWIELITHR